MKIIHDLNFTVTVEFSVEKEELVGRINFPWEQLPDQVREQLFQLAAEDKQKFGLKPGPGVKFVFDE